MWKTTDMSRGLPTGIRCFQLRVRRLADLSRSLGNRCDEGAKRRACRDCDELRFLLKLKSASEVVPDPPLSHAEEQRLRDLKETSARISKGKQAANREAGVGSGYV